MWNLCVYLGTLCRYYCSLSTSKQLLQHHGKKPDLAILVFVICQAKNVFEGFHRQAGFLDGNTEVPYGLHTRTVGCVEAKLYLSLDLFLVRHFWIMHECTSARAGRLFTRCGIFQTFDDCSFSTAIVAHDDSDWGKELNYGDMLIVERAYSPYCKFIQGRHVGRELSRDGHAPLRANVLTEFESHRLSSSMLILLLHRHRGL